MRGFGRERDLSEFGEVFHPTEAAEPILARPVRAALLEWLTEIWAAEELQAVGLKPRRRALFHGAPGGGKTTLAHHLAARLGLPMLAVRPDQVIDKYLGSTGQNLGALFDAARPAPEGLGPVVLFFDEFEALATKRRANAENAQREMNSVVDTLLQRMEAHDGYLIAATNLPGELDPAIWRRFDLQIELSSPGQEERERILARYLAPYALPSRALQRLAEACETATPALLRQFCEGVKRNIVIGPKVGWPMGRDDVIGRVLAAVAPHRDAGKPRLWSQGVADGAVPLIPWPLPMAGEERALTDAAQVSEAGGARIVPLGARAKP